MHSKAVKNADEPKDHEEFLNAVREVKGRVGAIEPDLHALDTELENQKKSFSLKIAHFEKQIATVFSSKEEFALGVDGVLRTVFRSWGESERYHADLDRRLLEHRERALASVKKLREELVVAQKQKEERFHDRFNARKIDLLNRCDELERRGIAWRSESKVKSVPWVILPNGLAPGEGHSKQFTEEGHEIRFDETRYQKILRLNPSEQYRGIDEFSGYFAFIFPTTDWVIFESSKIGNALYAVRGNWVNLSKKTKRELLEMGDERVKRVLHRGNWEWELRRLVELIGIGR